MENFIGEVVEKLECIGYILLVSTLPLFFILLASI
jgi:hypothetical protein